MGLAGSRSATELPSDGGLGTDPASVAQFIARLPSPERAYIADPGAGEPCALFVDGLSRSWTQKTLSSTLRTLGVTFRSAGKDRGAPCATVSFDSGSGIAHFLGSGRARAY